MNINELSKQIYEQNKAAGWWDDQNRCIWTTIQLISTEVAEATEGERKDLMDDHLPHRKMGEVELADALIRTLDLGGRLDLHYEHCKGIDLLKWKGEPGAMHLSINLQIILFAEELPPNPYQNNIKSNRANNAYSDLIDSIIQCARILNYDIETAMMEKLEYNKNRTDHKRENRQKEGGKKF